MQFAVSVFRPPTCRLTIFGGYKKVFRPPTHTLKICGGIKKMLIFFANVHVKRRQLIFHGILLRVDHHSEKINSNKNSINKK